MLVDHIREGELKVTLTAVEICDFFGSYDAIRYDSAAARRAMGRLLSLAAEDCGFTLRGSTLQIKVSPTYSGGCVIRFITEREIKPVPAERFYIFEFSLCENLLSACDRIKAASSGDPKVAIYTLGGKYRLFLPESDANKSLLAVIYEYSDALYGGELETEKTREHWRKICADTPISDISITI